MAHNKEIRIAIVDDNLHAAETLEYVLKKRGVATQVFPSCEKLLESHPEYDAYITDTDLGHDMNGFDCAKEIRARDPNAVIVGISLISESEGDVAKKESELREIYRRLGADDFVNRTDGSGVIAARVLELLAGR
ncbi:response regulator [Patescibacteria group bacterium]|nr:response regulator [Patescibacteria group bacterium]MBU1472458.1 response regulator [Patescibacteria group bacterium]MBU2460272.1 response regulator [Patescibacteria group bacterium]MBU2544599.1 response regulator [Patescibacteria group bacterium]